MTKITFASVLIFLGISIVLISATPAFADECDFKDREEYKFHNDLLSLEYANPYEDFTSDEKSGNLRFVGLMGYTLYFPGLDSRELNTEIRNGKYEYRLIEGTSDILVNYEHMRLTRIAQLYARTYNQLLRDKINQGLGKSTQANTDSNVADKSQLSATEDIVTMVTNCKTAIAFDFIEKANAYRDACMSINSSDFGFIAVAGEKLSFYKKHADLTLSAKNCKLIEINADRTTKDNYEFSRRKVIAGVYSGAYNERVEEELENSYSMNFMSEMEGFNKIRQNFKWYPPGIGFYSSCTGECFSVDIYLLDRTKAFLDAARWEVSYIDNTVKYDWNDFLELFNDSNSVLKRSQWLNKLKRESAEISVKLYIYNLSPHFDDIELKRVKAIWEREQLKSEPYYQVLVRMEVKKTSLLDMFISKDGNVAVVTQNSLEDHKGNPLLKNKHWTLRKPLGFSLKTGNIYLIIDNEKRTYYYSDNPSVKFKF